MQYETQHCSVIRDLRDLNQPLLNSYTLSIIMLIPTHFWKTHNWKSIINI